MAGLGGGCDVGRGGARVWRVDGGRRIGHGGGGVRASVSGERSEMCSGTQPAMSDRRLD